jgi:hypothetical protein
MAAGAVGAGWADKDAADMGADAGAATMMGAPTGPLTMRTLPSASVISNSDTLESETKSINVLSFLKSMSFVVFCS